MSASIPLPRTLKKGPPKETGKDVLATQRALHAIGALKSGYGPGIYGPRTIAAVAKFQAHHGLTSDGNYGPATHKKLTPWFDAYGHWLELQAVHALQPKPREAVVHTGYFYYQWRRGFIYSQARPIPTVYYGIRPPSLPRAMDCSGFFVTCYWVNNLIARLGGGTNTWSLYSQGHSVDVSSMQPGDAVFYDGPEGSLQHMSLYVGNGRVLSNGHYPMGLYPTNMAPGYLKIHGARSYL